MIVSLNVLPLRNSLEPHMKHEVPGRQQAPTLDSGPGIASTRVLSPFGMAVVLAILQGGDADPDLWTETGSADS